MDEGGQDRMRQPVKHPHGNNPRANRPAHQRDLMPQIAVPTPPTKPPYKFALKVGVLIAAAAWMFPEYLQVKGIQSAAVARVFLFGCLASLVGALIITVDFMRLRRPKLVCTVGSLVLAVGLVGLDLWAPGVDKAPPVSTNNISDEALDTIADRLAVKVADKLWQQFQGQITQSKQSGILPAPMPLRTPPEVPNLGAPPSGSQKIFTLIPKPKGEELPTPNIDLPDLKVADQNSDLPADPLWKSDGSTKLPPLLAGGTQQTAPATTSTVEIPIQNPVSRETAEELLRGVRSMFSEDSAACFSLKAEPTYSIEIKTDSNSCMAVAKSDNTLYQGLIKAARLRVAIQVVAPGGFPVGTLLVPMGVYPVGTPSAFVETNNRLLIVILRPDGKGYGQLPGRVMASGKPGSLDLGILLAHELGHALFWNSSEAASDWNSLEFENVARRIRGLGRRVTH